MVGVVSEIVHLGGILLKVVQLPFVEIVEMDQLVALGAYASMSANHVCGALVAEILVIVVVETLSPVGGLPAQHQRHQAQPLHLFDGCISGGDPRQVEKSLGVIEIADEVLIDASGVDDTWPADDQRCLVAFLVHEALVEPAMFTEEKALIG